MNYKLQNSDFDALFSKKSPEDIRRLKLARKNYKDFNERIERLKNELEKIRSGG